MVVRSFFEITGNLNALTCVINISVLSLTVGFSVDKSIGLFLGFGKAIFTEHGSYESSNIVKISYLLILC